MRYEDYFKRTRMPKDFHSFAEKAIEIAGRAGERKRQFKTREAGALAKSRMAEVERKETGLTRRRGLMEAGQTKRRGMGLATEASKRGGLAGAGVPESTRMKSFDFASKTMSEMYPERINPVTNKPFSTAAWKKRLTELANEREAYGGIQPTEEQPAGLGGRGRVVTEGGMQYDITPGVAGFTKGMATPEMMKTAGFGAGVQDKNITKRRGLMGMGGRFRGYGATGTW